MFIRKFLSFLIIANLFIPGINAMENKNIFNSQNGKNELNNKDSFKDLCYSEDNVHNEAQIAGCMNDDLFKEQKYLMALNHCCYKAPRLLAYGADRTSFFSYLKCSTAHLFHLEKQGRHYCFLGNMYNYSLYLSYFASDCNENEVIPSDLFDKIFDNYPELEKIYVNGKNNDLTAADVNSININKRFIAKVKNDGTLIISKK